VTTANQLLTREEIKRLTAASDGRGAAAVLFDWMVIGASLAAAAALPHPAVLALVVVILGGRQLALAVLMHEAAHGSLFRTTRLNPIVGRWLCGAPVWSDVERYRRHHLGHHAHTGTERDPDLCLVEPFPASGPSLARKLLRDVLGITGVRRAAGLLAMDFDLLTYTASGDAKRLRSVPWRIRLANGARRLAPVVTTNLALWGILAATGHGWLYLLWAIAWLTTFSLFLRVRSIAEHACTEASADLLRNTRTLEASLLARAFVAPHSVALHLEHHLLPTVPYFRLAELHRLLEERGALDQSPRATSYLEVLRLAGR
jgi:fatty acid desaturase